MPPTQDFPGTTPPPAPLTPSGGGGNDQWPIYAAIGCALLALCCLCGIGVSGAAWFFSQNGALGIGASRVHVSATVTSYLGLGGIGPGTVCDMPITAQSQQDGTQLCHVVMTCGGQVLYGDDQQGYFPCRFSTSPPSVVGQDASTSMTDHDGAFSIDTNARSAQLADDFLGRAGMFTLSANITAVTAE